MKTDSDELRQALQPTIPRPVLLNPEFLQLDSAPGIYYILPPPAPGVFISMISFPVGIPFPGGFWLGGMDFPIHPSMMRILRRAAAICLAVYLSVTQHNPTQ